MNATKNKTKPFIHRNEYQDPDRQEPVVTLRTMLYAAKHKDGLYRVRDFMWSCTKSRAEYLNSEKVVEDVVQEMKRGKYHDWFFVEKPLVGQYPIL